MNRLIITPSVLSLDFSDTKSQLEGLRQSRAEWIHYDVMDSHFVPDLTFGPKILKTIKRATGKFMDVHVMIDNPAERALMYMDAGADMLTFHIESVTEGECGSLCREIRSQSCQVGIALSPNTPVERVLPFIPDVDMILILSVEPGHEGQVFQEWTLDKVRAVRELTERKHLQTRIEIDGGINLETGKKAVDAGCDTLVSGSYVFKNGIVPAIDNLLTLRPTI